MKYCFTILAILLFQVLCLGQIKEYGLKLGVSSTQCKFYNPTSNISRIADWGNSVYAEVYAEVYHYKNFNLNVGTGIMERNSIATYKIISPSTPTDSISISEAFTTRNFFLSIEGKIKTHLAELPKLTPYMLFGPQFGILNQQSKNIDIELSPYQFNWMIGLGFDYDFKKASVFAEWQRYVNFDKNYSTTSNAVFTQKSFVICIGIKYLVDQSNLSNK